LDIVRVKGQIHPGALYELVGEKSTIIPDSKLEAIALYEAGRKAYLNRDFTTALSKFAAVLSLTPEDSAATLHIQRCQHWLKTALPSDWDGVETLTEK
jgi:adenylate cyclase